MSNNLGGQDVRDSRGWDMYQQLVKAREEFQAAWSCETESGWARNCEDIERAFEQALSLLTLNELSRIGNMAVDDVMKLAKEIQGGDA